MQIKKIKERNELEFLIGKKLNKVFQIYVSDGEDDSSYVTDDSIVLGLDGGEFLQLSANSFEVFWKLCGKLEDVKLSYEIEDSEKLVFKELTRYPEVSCITDLTEYWGDGEEDALLKGVRIKGANILCLIFGDEVQTINEQDFITIVN